MSTIHPQAAEVTRPATLEHLPAFLACLDATASAAGVGDETAFALHLAVEEACANVIKHGYPDAPGPLTVRVEVTSQAVTVVLTDRAAVFDPDRAPAPPLDGTVEDRPIGGLGWHLIRELTDEVRHESPPGGGNRLTLVKRLLTSTSPDP